MPHDEQTDTVPAVTGVPPDTPNAAPHDSATLAQGPRPTDERVTVHPTEEER
jgi:hypothetical protein